MKLKCQLYNPNFIGERERQRQREKRKNFMEMLFYWAQLSNPVILC